MERFEQPAAGASGVILAGGSSRRMGCDKASLMLNGETLLARTTRVLQEVVGSVSIVGWPADHEAQPGVSYLPDRCPGQGPLVSLAFALSQLQCPYALVVACDLPFLRADVLRYLLAVAPGWDAVVPRVAGRAQPLHAVYSRAVLDSAQQLSLGGERRLSALLDRLTVRWIEEHEIIRLDPDLRSLTNVNTARQWQAALQRTEAGI